MEKHHEHHHEHHVHHEGCGHIHVQEANICASGLCGHIGHSPTNIPEQNLYEMFQMFNVSQEDDDDEDDEEPKKKKKKREN